MSVISKIFGDTNEKAVKSFSPVVDEINALEQGFEKIGNEELKVKTKELKKKIAGAQDKEKMLNEILPEAFALVREASKRTLGQRHFDVQLMGGAAIHQGKVVEMKTGEGKTLVATLPAYLNALTGKGVHIITVNDYLSRRDAAWMGQIYHLLGISVACINHESSFLYDPSFVENREEMDKERDELGSFKVVHEFLRPCSRAEAYRADITYGTNNEFGFDYLRDNLAQVPENLVQRNEKEEGGHNFAIIDEVDSILIDEARTPLIISTQDSESAELYKVFAGIAPRLKEGADYNLDEKMKAVSITEEGIDKVENMLGVGDIYTDKGIKYVHHLEQALKAQAIFARDRDYVVKNGEIIIVDQFTGRLMPGRRWSEGLHQAVEAKENVQIQKESRTVASITFQNYFRMYKKLSGMTGTAATSAEEFHKVYNVDVIILPTNKPLIRKDNPDMVFQTEKGKFQAVVREIKERNEKGQPVLVGTVSIERNEYLSALLKKEGIDFKMLNAKQHEQEGEIIAQAGRVGGVTIATNMAGRGVDIVLGGAPLNIEEAEKVRDLGGLFVLGTERHEARRIDNQLRGRAGRQGDPGETQFFVSLEDDLMRVFGSDRIKNMMGSFGVPEDEPIQNKMISRAIESAQTKIEGFNFDARKHILEYDDVLNKQRSSIYKMRNKILFSKKGEAEEEVFKILKEETEFIVNAHTIDDVCEHWDIEEIFENIKSRFNVGDEVHQKLLELQKQGEESLRTTAGQDVAENMRAEIKKYLNSLIKEMFDARKQELGLEGFVNLLRAYFLQIIDMLWMQHLEVMDYMRSSVRLRAYGQRDPLIEYKNEGLRLFKEMQVVIRAHISGMVFKVGSAPKQKEQARQEVHPQAKVFGSSPLSKDAAVINAMADKSMAKVGRNEPCPCGSGKKFKKCHGA